MTTLLEICDLLIQREKKTVLQVDHLSVEKGEVLAIVGPNGSGKSTLLLAIAHLLKADQGHVTFCAEPPAAHSSLAYRRRISLVLQEPVLVNRRVFDNVALGLRFRHLPKIEIDCRVDEWLERMKITHLRNRKASQISGGEAQRVSLARAFAIQPDLILLDEPFSSLDAPTRAHLLDDLRSVLAQTKTTIIFVTHDLAEAKLLGQSMAVILSGCLQQWGQPDHIFQHPANPSVAAFLGIPWSLSRPSA